MKLKKLVGIIGVAALSASMFAGAASAEKLDDSELTASVDVTCSAPATVALGGSGVFNPITNSTEQHSTRTAPGGITVEVNMGCYWGPWEVDAQITNFRAAPGQWFHASHFSLVDATVDSYFLDPVDGRFDLLEPTANDAHFTGPRDENTILETTETWFWWFGWHQGPDVPAPFVTTASYTGELTNLPAYLHSGTYSATLTVELTND